MPLYTLHSRQMLTLIGLHLFILELQFLAGQTEGQTAASKGAYYGELLSELFVLINLNKFIRIS